ncbi:hypothetical protein [Lentibacillus sp. CBA3610]|uniref:hypothetical protein n=1 Tax=Lentibacillus sp. CBA3610 TaxID=2518176 RepID=UPI0015952C58|nr:hypothetical protein [Lentibacillus sp. CBA3610]QKY70766.1 hypothetical protein Len3610_15285 [Lentibacillus sp. CBA3610]
MTMWNHIFQDINYDKENGEKKTEVNAWMRPYAYPGEREEFVEKAKIAKQFDMPFRGLVEFYGDDLIAYKQKIGSCRHANAFLRIFTNYVADHLEDQCPTSWQACQPAFWEELIFAYFPSQLKITTKQSESELFLIQLKKFVRWLDQRTGCAWYPTVEKYTEEARTELIICERLFNNLVLRLFPNAHLKEQEREKDLDKIKNAIRAASEVYNSVYKVTAVTEDFITVTDIDSTRVFQIVGLPADELALGVLLEGVMGRYHHDDFFYTWFFTENVYPEKAENYFVFVD